ncbi:hypothetical protein ACVMAJ_000152 [Bradyrhizobium sp. USDA 4448]
MQPLMSRTNLAHQNQSLRQLLIQQHQRSERRSPSHAATISSTASRIDQEQSWCFGVAYEQHPSRNRSRSCHWVSLFPAIHKQHRLLPGCNLRDHLRCQAGSLTRPKRISFLFQLINRGGGNCLMSRNGASGLLVLKVGSPIPPACSGKRWRKSRRRILKVSHQIKFVVQREGYYVRSLQPRKELGSKRSRSAD